MNDRKKPQDSKNISYSSVETQRALRIERMNELKALGVDPFTPHSHRDMVLSEVKKSFEENKGKVITLAGRIKGKRTSGKIAFATIEDESLPEGFQFIFKKDDLPDTRVWTLKFSFDESLDAIITGIKTIETRALNPEEKEEGRYFGDICKGDIIQLLRESTGEKYTYKAGEVFLYSSLDDAWEKGLDFSKVSSKNTKYSSVSDLKKEYAEELTPQYLNKIQTNGLIAFTLEKLTEDQKMSGVKLSFDNFKKLIDEGDYIQATGLLDFSQSGEPSLFVQDYKILTKALRPLPEEIEDKEILFRQRYLDMRLHPEVRDLFTKKAKFWTATKEYMDQNGFTQVYMPIMQETTGGAEADPFVTHHNDLDEDFYLGISPELHLKRMIVGGFEKVYDMGKNFRNEGIDDEHLQEFYRIEFYWAYATHEQLMEYTEALMKYSIEKAFGTLELKYLPRNEHGEFTNESVDVDWAQPWPKMSYYDFIEHFGGVDLRKYPQLTDLKNLARDLEINFDEADGFGRITDLIYKKIARPKCIQPVWMTEIPTRLSPLAKRDPKQPELTLRSHLLAYGSELTNGYSELNDPIDQLERFAEQQKARDNGDEEAMMTDLDFVQALEIGMPPTVGFAYSDRLFDLLANRTMKESTPFPLMRREDNDANKASKKTMVAHILMLNIPEIPLWSKLNTAAHLSASFASRIGNKLILIDESTTLDDENIPMNIQHVIIMKQTSEQLDLLDLKHKADKMGLTVSCFTEEMRDSSNDQIADNKQSMKDSTQIGWLGILIFGKKSDVEELTDKFERFS